MGREKVVQIHIFHVFDRFSLPCDGECMNLCTSKDALEVKRTFCDEKLIFVDSLHAERTLRNLFVQNKTLKNLIWNFL